MGTNYYFRKPLANHCEHCGRSDPPEELHIGKSSSGWCFSLHVHPEKQISTLDDWEDAWAGKGSIFDEYGTAISIDEMRLIITKRNREKDWETNWWAPKPCGLFSDGKPFILPGYNSEEHFHRSNHSERGPNGLLRHRIDENHCIGHGVGTWDHIIGDFS